MTDMPEYPYVNQMNVKYAPLEVIDVPAEISGNTHRWFNQTPSKASGSVVRLGIMQGGYHWHKHDEDDGLFFVVEGQFLIGFEDRTVKLHQHQGMMVPKGVIHRTRAPEKAVVLMVETAGIVPTGDR